MKKMLTITAIAGLLVSMSFANWTEGTKSVGGGFTWSSSKTGTNDAVTTMIVNPAVGYFVMDNMAVNFGLAYSKVGDFDATTGWNIGGTYYMNEWYGNAAYGTTGADDSNYLRFGGGYLHSLSDGIYLNTGLQYNMGMGDNETNTTNFVVGVSTYF